MFQVKISSRGIAHKGMVKVALLVAAFFGFCFGIDSTPVHAASECSDSSGNGWAVRYYYGNISYGDGVDRNTVEWRDGDEKVLALNNYQGGSICIDGVDEVVLEIEGENGVLPDEQIVIESGVKRVIVRGEGSLRISGGQFNVLSELYIESGDLRLIDDGEDPDSACDVTLDGLYVVGGNLYSECSINTDVNFYQNDGILEIEVDKRVKDDFPCLYAGFLVFDGGVTNIDCKENIAVGGAYMTAFEGFIPEMSVATEDGVMRKITDEETCSGICLIPYHGSILFNDGDITLKGKEAAMVVSLAASHPDYGGPDVGTFLREKGEGYLVTISDGLGTDPVASVKSVVLGDDNKAAVSTFVVGDGDFLIDGMEDGEMDDITTSTNVAREIHITKAGAVVPKADGDDGAAGETEENPNTIDTKIVGIALGTLFAIIAEGVIIGDLYRRLFSYEKEIANIDEKSDYTSEDTPDKA